MERRKGKREHRGGLEGSIEDAKEIIKIMNYTYVLQCTRGVAVENKQRMHQPRIIDIGFEGDGSVVCLKHECRKARKDLVNG